MTNIRGQDVHGQGLSFPPRVGSDGRLAWSKGDDNVRESLRLILLTEPRERVMREDFGCGLRRFLFEPNTPSTRALIRERIERAITRWEPRVRLEDVRVESGEDESVIEVAISYRLVASGASGSLGLGLQVGA